MKRTLAALVVAVGFCIAFAATEPPDTSPPARPAPHGTFMRTVLHGSLSGSCAVAGPTRYDRDFYSAEKHTMLFGFSWCDQKALCRIESGLNPKAKAKTTSAKGLCQLVDMTFAENAPGRDPWDPHDNIHASAAEMVKNLGFWHWKRTPMQRKELAIASYKEGRGAMGRAQQACGMGLTLADIAPCTPAPGVEHVRRWHLALDGGW